MHSKSKNPFVLAVLAISAVSYAGCGESQQTTKEAASPTPTTNGPSCNPKVGAHAPSLSIDSLSTSGKASIAPGKVTLVDFWATWCGPCRESFPKYQELYTKYKSRGFEIIAVSVDEDSDKGKIPDFIKAKGAKFPVGWDKGHALAECWKPNVMPTAFLIDKKGVVRQIHAEWHNGNEKELEEQIKSLL